MKRINYKFQDLTIDLIDCQKENKPLVLYFYFDELDKFIEKTNKLKKFNLIAVPVAKIENDLFTRLDHLKISELIEDATRKLEFKVSNKIVMGYSMSGLISVYLCYNSFLFDALISCSSSFWFNNFIDYALNNQIKSKLKIAYFSIGKKENFGKTIFSNSIELTKKMVDIFNQNNINTYFELNEGNHFNQINLRLYKGLSYCLSFL